ncbi:MAG: type II toxin-antitoxin system Phd/YefM family antitoxin [Acidobacteria bacterium]|nr:type II toxin-antitoxin system Phd/YefM family antitoxin [Acidobacteriota bacterium]
MKVLPLSEVKAKLSKLVDVVERRDESITITRNGKAVAILVSKDEYDGWHETIQILRDPEFLREIRDGIRKLARTKKRYTVEELLAE